MAVIVLCSILSVLISTAVTIPCDFSEDIDANSQTKNEYFSWEQNSSCYIFALKKADLKEASYVCQRIGGHLTDIDTVNNNILQNYIETELVNYTRISDTFWIGLLWSSQTDRWYWQTGEPIVEVLLNQFSLSRYTGNCALMKLNEVENDYCWGKRNFICKLNLGCSHDSHVENTTCSSRCKTLIKKNKADTSRAMTPVLTPSTTVENTNDTTQDPNTTYVDTTGRDDVQNNQCKLHMDGIDNTTTTILAVLGGVVAVLLVTVCIMTATILRYRRLLSGKGRTHRISLVDILNADSTETSKVRPVDQAGSHPGSTTELLYTSVDSTYTLPNKGDRNETEESNSAYQNQRSLQGEDRDSGSLPSSPSNGAQSYGQGQDVADNNYSQLNHNEETSKNSDSHDTYGINSASAPVDLSSGKSPTYESYM